MDGIYSNNNVGSSNTNRSGDDNTGGMGFLFLFFPENGTSGADDIHDRKKTSRPMAAMNLLFPSPPSFRCLRRYSVSSGGSSLLSTVKSTVSVCALLIFLTLLLFTLCFDPAVVNSPRHLPPRRHLSSPPSPPPSSHNAVNLSFPHALQGMGSLYSRGTRAMNDLIIAHAVENLTPLELKLFLRLFFTSGLSSKSDILLIFRSKSPAFDRVVAEENDSFLKLILGRRDRSSEAILGVAQFKISEKKKKESGEPIWGRKIKRNNNNNIIEGNSTESTRMSYGSVVGFDADELDPEDSLAGFLDHVPMSLRRWACYPMLLGRVRRNFRHVTLVDVKEILLLGDPLGRVKNRTPESVYLTTHTQSKHVKNSGQNSVHPGIVAGGTRGVRRLSNAMLTEIVQAAMQRKRKNPVTESGVINQLVRSEFALRNVNLMVSSESIPRLSSLTGLNSKPGATFLPIVSKLALARPGNSNGDGSVVILKHLCSLSLDSQVYPDC
ncbi:PREDICTED: uncharacterized protein LOC109181128 [Ipomoea nil]|uniref:uncharacterized protein LOC109181128 n=1 Tax=Ipomoea nil TaxID=35883 RepID=UPI0009008AC2|nr:PREDICTED: uncharacterized protein LOC109181128 [Ipomoea nil]